LYFFLIQKSGGPFLNTRYKYLKSEKVQKVQNVQKATEPNKMIRKSRGGGVRYAHLLEQHGYLLWIDAAIVCHVLVAPLVHIHFALFALKALSPRAPQQRAAVVAKREQFERVNHEPVRHIYVKTFVCSEHGLGVLDARTLGDDVCSTPFVYDTRAHLTLIALCVEHAPDKIAANRAKCWLPKISGHELVAVDLMNFASHGNATSVKCLSGDDDDDTAIAIDADADADMDTHVDCPHPCSVWWSCWTKVPLKSTLRRNLPFGSRSSQRSWVRSGSRSTSSMLQLATNSSGGNAES
ncbi:hypothetical protein BpHYR1_009730, partial [Brachionus plicatilis]